MEIHMAGGGLTWSNNHEFPTLVKLDRVLMSKNWEDIFPLVKVEKLPRILSYHNPLIIESEKPCKKSYSAFFFEIEWLSHQTFKKIIEDIWSKPCRAKSTLDRIQQKLKLCKRFLKGWDWNLKGETKKERPNCLRFEDVGSE
jgi:hypothetical protein